MDDYEKADDDFDFFPIAKRDIEPKSGNGKTIQLENVGLRKLKLYLENHAPPIIHFIYDMLVKFAQAKPSLENTPVGIDTRSRKKRYLGQLHELLDEKVKLDESFLRRLFYRQERAFVRCDKNSITVAVIERGMMEMGEIYQCRVERTRKIPDEQLRRIHRSAPVTLTRIELEVLIVRLEANLDAPLDPLERHRFDSRH